MRVISGTLKGRRLRAPEGRGTRPILDRQKEALFNILQQSLPCEGVLDLFAGSGSLGIEALSRGASRATFVEAGGQARRVLEANLSDLGLAGVARVLAASALDVDLERVGQPLGLVFCDPPFGLSRDDPEAVVRLLTRIAREARLESGAVLVLRIPAEAGDPPLPAGLELRDRRRMGESLLLFYAEASGPPERAAGGADSGQAPQSGAPKTE